ncbi:coiled-coil domain-containing protein 124-like [Stegodyphus dumicola]|uniref:coiled-coil domain-containing protein 124-like n=1 Tax=Stegodyphus dumicola TaxID=202533 RepID=UPI0015A85092|nr:coiled-coil domain-containing protein 124-like [Stegodyphus dumicola]
MPKKFGSNTKSVEARERREAVKAAERERKEREAEEALWKDDDKHVLRKQQRKEEREKKKQEVQEKKLASKMAYEEEMNSIKPAKPAVTKVTRAEIEKLTEKSLAKPQKEPLHIKTPLEENVNRLHVEGEVARSVDDAIAILSISNEKPDLHPEKRVKAAYQAYEERNLPRLKAENSNLRLSQLKQMLKKDWMKSPENPLNQRHAGFKA